MIFHVVLAVLGLMAAWCIWGCIANMITYEQRGVISRVVFDSKIINNNFEQYEKNLAALKEVTYNDHYSRLFWFKNPMQLYPYEIQDGYKNLKNQET